MVVRYQKDFGTEEDWVEKRGLLEVVKRKLEIWGVGRKRFEIRMEELGDELDD